MTHQALHRILSRHRSSFAMLWLFSVFFNVLVLVLPLYMLAIFSNVLTSRSHAPQPPPAAGWLLQVALRSIACRRERCIALLICRPLP